jgi:hypothetical protein
MFGWGLHQPFHIFDPVDRNQPLANVDAQSLHKAVFFSRRHPCGAQKSPTTLFFKGSLG